jgi:hypothetical protein
MAIEQDSFNSRMNLAQPKQLKLTQLARFTGGVAFAVVTVGPSSCVAVGLVSTVALGLGSTVAFGFWFIL